MKEDKSTEIINWETKYETGIKRVDFEHKIFLELINSFKIAIDNNRPEDELVRIIIEIEKYAVFHFISEENFMNSIEYPEYKNHQIQHFDLLEKFNLAKFDKQGFPKFYDFIKEWFINHTIYEDRKIKDFIIEKNIDIEKFYYNISI